MRGPTLLLRKFDYEPEWHVELRVTDGVTSTSIDFYTQDENLESFAEALNNFPRYLHDEASFEVGSDLGRQAYHVYLRGYIFDSVGHSALEVLTDNHAKPPDHARVHFSVRCEVAALNRLGEQLLQWIKAPEQPLEWHV